MCDGDVYDKVLWNISFSCLTCKLPKSIYHVVVGPVSAIVVTVLENNLTHPLSQAPLPLALEQTILTGS